MLCDKLAKVVSILLVQKVQQQHICASDTLTRIADEVFL